MRKLCLVLVVCMGLQAAFACSEPPALGTVPATLEAWASGAQLFEGLGESHRAVTTSNLEAQAFFDQGLRLVWAFNHDEAARSFARAAVLDADCALCYWGFALTVGPNYNLPLLTAARARLAWNVLQAARAHAGHASAVERALIDALAARYPDPSPLDPAALAPVARAYADAMGRVARRFADDSDVQTLYAEALMNTTPWKLWRADGMPAQDTPQILATLERVLARDQQHPGANHYYVHAVEASPHPERALSAAQRMRGLMPFAGHMEHMPAHIYQRLGRYRDAAAANRRGAEADLRYYARTQPLDYYSLYTGHNYHFLMYSAAMAGREADTLAAARELSVQMSDAFLQHYAGFGFDWYAATGYAALVRFGRWDDVLTIPPPRPELLGKQVGYLSARVSALVARGRLDEAAAELAELEALAVRVPADYAAGQNVLPDILKVALPFGHALLAAARGDTSEAFRRFAEAAANEDRLAYDEPRPWFIPVRQVWGELLLTTGDYAAAERVYRDDLDRNPDNGWSLFGLRAALQGTHRDTEAAAVGERLRAAWKGADVSLHASLM